MFKKRLLALALALSTLVTFTACGGSESPAESTAAPANGASEPVTMSLAHIRPDGSPADIAIKAFTKEAEELSGGTLTFEIYPASQLGDYTTVQERVMIGDVDMQIATIGTNIDKMFGLSNVGYLATNWDEARIVFGSDGVLVSAYKEKLDEFGLTFLGAYPLYFGGIALKKPPVDPTNPNAKSGIKIRVPSMTTYEKSAVALGYLATPLPSSETFTSLQTGVVDGAVGMGAEGYFSNMSDLVNHYLPINDHFEQWYLYINSDKFASLSQNQQDALTTAAKHMEEKRWEIAEVETVEFEKKLVDNGTEVVVYSDEQLAEFASVIRQKVWPLIADEYGRELFDQLTAGLK
jgi:TRAP-type C4-dicarboxylate transport system substrate-binding protein